MTEREALKLALEALGSNRRTHHYCEDTWYSCPKHEDGCANDSEGDECNCGADKANAGIDQAITAIKAALEAKDEPVPVAIVEVFGKDWRLDYMALPVGKHKLYAQQYTYTTPPQRKPLTDEEIIDHFKASVDTGFLLSFVDGVRYAEAAHGIKGKA